MVQSPGTGAFYPPVVQVSNLPFGFPAANRQRANEWAWKTVVLLGGLCYGGGKRSAVLSSLPPPAGSG
jgi:hypothetical protein